MHPALSGHTDRNSSDLPLERLGKVVPQSSFIDFSDDEHDSDDSDCDTEDFADGEDLDGMLQECDKLQREINVEI